MEDRKAEEADDQQGCERLKVAPVTTQEGPPPCLDLLIVFGCTFRKGGRHGWPMSLMKTSAL
ncbi:hypothetical protein D3C72_2172460 [compost metagenome]